MSKKSLPILYDKLLHKMGKDFFDMPYVQERISNRLHIIPR